MRAILLLIFLFLSLASVASEAITEFGQIIFSKELSNYYFVFQRDNLTYAYQIPVKTQADRDHLKSLLEKMIRVNGRVDFVRNHKDSFSAKEEVTLLKVDQFDFKLLGFDMKKFLEQEKYISHERAIILNQSSGLIAVSDEAANSFIAAGAVTIGILTGPLSLIPLGVFGITQF